MKMSIRELMIPPAIISQGTSLGDAARVLKRDDCDRIYLLDERHELMGVVTDYSLLKAVLRGEPLSACCDALVQPVEETLCPDQPLERAAVLFRCGHRTQIPIVDNHRLVGCLRREDLLEYLIEHAPDAEQLADEPRTEDAPPPATATALSSLLATESRRTG